jgi:hypothetical protein
MRRESLCTAIRAGLSATRIPAIDLCDDALGQVIVRPYYLVGWEPPTVVDVVNLQGESKLVRVRFLEGRNSREVRDFNLYLSPYDVWTSGTFGLAS